MCHRYILTNVIHWRSHLMAELSDLCIENYKGTTLKLKL